MIIIPLTQGKVALIDDADGPRVRRYKWRAAVNRRTGKCYAISQTPGTHSWRKSIYLHRLILDAPEGVDVDHRDGDGLNCRRYNIRLASRRQNRQNSAVQINSISGLKGVYRCRSGRRRKRPWMARIKTITCRLCIGYFETDTQAAMAYDTKAKELFGEFALLNFPEVLE